MKSASEVRKAVQCHVLRMMLSHHQLCLALSSSEHPTQVTSAHVWRSHLSCFPVSWRVTPHKFYSICWNLKGEIQFRLLPAVTTKAPDADVPIILQVNQLLLKGSVHKCSSFAGHIVSITTTKFCYGKHKYLKNCVVMFPKSSCTLKFEFYIILICHKILFFWLF